MENNEEFTQNSTLEEANSDAEEASCVMEQSDAQTLQETPSETAQETSTETAQPPRKKSSKLNTALNVALWVLLALLVVALVLRLFVFGSITIRGESMTAGFYTDPNTAEYNVDLTFHEFDVVTVNKVAAPKRGDVVVFYKFHVDSKFLAMFGHGEDVERDGKYEKLIKRVVALGGDKLWVERQTNGKYRLVVQTPEGKFYEDYYVKDGETLSLGRHSLAFVFAPMVHWPEVMVSYDAFAKTLFSADGFGKFGALDVDEEWDCEARRYYVGIVGKYGNSVQILLKKAAALDIQTICPLHGPVLSDDLAHYLNLYDTWSSYRTESDGVCICYTSVYGHTKEAVDLLVSELKRRNCPKVVVHDLARCDMAEAVEDAFRYGKIVLASTTYNASVFPFMHDFAVRLAEHNFQNKSVALIENGSWAPMAAKTLSNLLAPCKNLTFCDTITILSALTEQNREQIAQLAAKLCE